MNHVGRNDLDLVAPAVGHVHFNDQRVTRNERGLGDKVVARGGADVGEVAERRRDTHTQGGKE